MYLTKSDLGSNDGDLNFYFFKKYFRSTYTN